FFDTDGYVAVAPSDRGPIDTSITSRHGTGDLTLEHVEEGSPRLFVRGNYFDESRENGTPLQTNDTRMSQVSAGADVPKVFDGDLSVRVYGISERYHQVFSAVSGDRASERLTDLQTVPSGSFGLRTQWHRIWGTQRLVAGLEGAEVRGSSDEILGATGASFSNAGGHQRTGALFVNDSIPLGSRWILSAAARLDLWRNFDATLTKGATGSPGTVTELADRSNTAFSPRGSVLFRIDSNLSATASGYRSFRAPTLNELYRSFQLGNTLTLSNPDLAAEHLTGADAGLIWTAAGGGLLARGTFFWNEIDNAITSVTLSSTPTAITRQRQNLGQTRSQGVEVDAQAALTQDLSVSAGYLYADATVVSAADPALVGLRVPQVPRHQGSVRVSYQIGPVFLWAQGRWIGNQFEDDQNLLPLGSASIADVLLSGRVLRGIEVFGACENVFDAQYSVARTPVRSLGQPRTLRFGVRAVLF
ncbi:MAG TPA: TonB-dependent receptor, partial [Thermoanaerobaculia bacterium]